MVKVSAVRVSTSWASRYSELSAEAVRVLTAVTVLKVTEVVPTQMAIALGAAQGEVAAAVDELRETGWVTTSPTGRDVVVDGAEIWLRFDAPDQPAPDVAHAIAGRVLTAVRVALDRARHEVDDPGRWITAHYQWVLTAIRAGVRAALPDIAARVAAAAWQVAGHAPNPTWHRELACAGEQAATAARDPLTLSELLQRSAALCEQAGDWAAAEEQRVREAKLAVELGEHDRIVTSLTTLIAFYGRWGRPGPAVDALIALADHQRHAGNTVGRAQALAQLGALMLAAGRISTADRYLETAVDLFSHAAPGSVPPALQARVLELSGRALWQLRHPIRARRRFRHALAVLGDTDPAATHRIRALLDTHTDTPTLPDDTPASQALPVTSPEPPDSRASSAAANLTGTGQRR